MSASKCLPMLKAIGGFVLGLSLGIGVLRCLGQIKDDGPANAKQANTQANTSSGDVCEPGFDSFELFEVRAVAPDSKILRFKLPPQKQTLGASLPSALTVRGKSPWGSPDDPSSSIVLAKSYSPISFPGQEDYLELLVKGYPPLPDSDPEKKYSGLGSFLIALHPGQSVEMKVKADRMMHGGFYTPNRWKELAFVAGGTGIAPMLQMIRTIIADPMEKTNMSFVFANRHESDILMRDELDALALKHPHRFRVHYVLSSPPEPWEGGRGWVNSTDLSPPHLPAPSTDGTMILVCGRDEFLVTVSGKTARGPPPEGTGKGKKTKGPKIQGKLTGVLAEVGYTESQVYKF